jgi:hypothetical protein
LTQPAPRTAVIRTINGGLGDNLLFSTLPELYAERGVAAYVHADNPYRNPEIYDLVWARNPYVRGLSHDPPSAGAEAYAAAARDWGEGLGAIARIERAHGFPGTGRWPALYYEPRPAGRYRDRVLIDLSSTSVPFDYPGLAAAYLNYVCTRYGYRLDECLAVQFAREVAARPMSISGLEAAVVNDIYEYCDALASALALITVESGAHILASALRRDRPTPRIHALFSAKGFNDRVFVMPNVDYFVTGHVPLDTEFSP